MRVADRHHEMRQLVAGLFPHTHLDVIGDEVHADAVVTIPGRGRFAVECQQETTSRAEWEARTRSHNQAGLPVLWLWGVDHFQPLPHKPGNRNDEYGCAADVLHAHWESDRLIYVVDHASRLLAVTLGDTDQGRAVYRPDLNVWVDDYTRTETRRWHSCGSACTPTRRRTRTAGHDIVELGDRQLIIEARDRRQFTWNMPPPPTAETAT